MLLLPSLSLHAASVGQRSPPPTAFCCWPTLTVPHNLQLECGLPHVVSVSVSISVCLYVCMCVCGCRRTFFHLIMRSNCCLCLWKLFFVLPSTPTCLLRLPQLPHCRVLLRTGLSSFCALNCWLWLCCHCPPTLAALYLFIFYIPLSRFLVLSLSLTLSLRLLYLPCLAGLVCECFFPNWISDTLSKNPKELE